MFSPLYVPFDPSERSSQLIVYNIKLIFLIHAVKISEVNLAISKPVMNKLVDG